MRNTILIAKRELAFYVTSPMLYVITAIFLAITGFLFGISHATYLETSVRGFIEPCGLLVLVLAPIFTMRLISEEKKMGTLELLLSAPVKDTDVVLGKFIGCFSIFCSMLAFTLYYPLMLILFGNPDPGPIITGYLGLILFSGAALSIGLFASSMTSNQVLAAVVSGGILFFMWFIGLGIQLLPQPFGDIVHRLSFSFYFPLFARGVLDTRGFIYFLSVMILFLFLTVRSLENNKWN